MDNTNNSRTLPRITLIMQIVFSISLVIMYTASNKAFYSKWSDISLVILFVTAAVFFLITGITLAKNKTYDPLDLRTDALGLRYSIFFAVCSVVPYILQIAMLLFVPDAKQIINEHSSSLALLFTVINIYVIAFPILLLITRKIPPVKIKSQKLGAPMFFLCIAVTAGLCLIGAIIGFVFHIALTMPFSSDESSTTDIAQIMMSSSVWERTLVAGILAPVFEELIFRKILIERTIKYGQTASMLISGLMFGLFHGNFQQFFFAFFLGMLFAKIYMITGRIRYSIFLHMIVNLSTSLVTTSLVIRLMPYIESTSDNFENLPADVLGLFALLGMWMLFIGAVALTGIILLIVFFKRFKPYKAPDDPPAGQIIRSLIYSPMFLGFMILCLSEFAGTYLPDIIVFLTNQ